MQVYLTLYNKEVSYLIHKGKSKPNWYRDQSRGLQLSQCWTRSR